MKTEDQNSAIAKVCGLEDKYVLIKRGLYYRPDYKGYTNDINEDGRYTEKEAQEGAYLTAGEVTFEKLPIPDYVNDLNLIYGVEKLLSFHQQTDYIHSLATTDLLNIEPNQLTMNECWYICHATARQRAEALLKTLNLWVE